MGKSTATKPTPEQQAWASGVELAPKRKREKKVSPAYSRAFERPLVHVDIRRGIVNAYRLREMWKQQGMVTRSE